LAQLHDQEVARAENRARKAGDNDVTDPAITHLDRDPARPGIVIVTATYRSA
jgi:hypothetical protein